MPKRSDEYFKGRICARCGSSKTSSSWCKERNEKGIPTGNFLCNKCWMKDYNKTPYSNNGARREIANYKNKNIDTTTKLGGKFLGECIVATVLGIRNCDNCNIYQYSYHGPYDLDSSNIKNLGYGNIDVKTSSLIDNLWKFGNRKKIDCDTYFCLGMDGNIPWRNVVRLYIIPNEGWICDLDSINIHNISNSKYRIFEIDVTSYNNAYHYILSRVKDCPVLIHKCDDKP